MSKKTDLRAFFTVLHEKVNQKVVFRASFRVEITKKIIELQFEDEDDAQIALYSLKGKITYSTEKPDAVFYYWKEDVDNYVGKDNINFCWYTKDDFGELSFVVKTGLFCSDKVRKKFYYCCFPSNVPDRALACHAMYQSFSQWASTENMILFHSAAVGLNGEGVLINGRGGAGKTTLSTACLIDGMDFISDDYTICKTVSDKIEAYPLYSSISLAKDMYCKLNPDMPIVGTTWKNKFELDASKYKFAEKLIIKAMIVPSFSDNDNPEIIPIDKGIPIVRTVHSTLIQQAHFHDTERVKIMSSALSGLKAYKFIQCKDFKKNVNFIRDFISKELSNV